jgi:hypothetical protein
MNPVQRYTSSLEACGFPRLGKTGVRDGSRLRASSPPVRGQHPDDAA